MYEISLPQIEIFLTAAEKLNFSKAAQTHFVTPSAISKSIKNLEDELDTELFTREKKRLILTPQGEYLYKSWRHLLDNICDSVETMHQMGFDVPHELRVGCLSGFDYDSFLPELLRAYEDAYPAVQAEITSLGFRSLREGLLDGGFDLIVTTDFSLDDAADISQMVLEELQLYIALSTAHPLAQHDSLRLVELKNEVFYQISAGESQLAGERLLRSCKRQGFTPIEIKYVPNIPSLAMALKHSLGVTVCGDEIYKGNEKFIKLIRTEDLPTDAFTCLAWKKTGTCSAALRFIELARKWKL